MFNSPYGFPFILNSGQGNQDPIEQMEKTVNFLKKMRDADKIDEKLKEAASKPKSAFSKTECFMMLLATSSIMQTILVLWLLKGR